MTRGPLLEHRDNALWLGLAFWLAGTVLLYDAYEARARKRPAAFKLAGLIG